MARCIKLLILGFILLHPVLRAQETGNDDKFSGFVLKAFEKESRNDFQGALDDYGRALALKNDSVTILIRKAYVEAKLGQYIQTGRD